MPIYDEYFVNTAHKVDWQGSPRVIIQDSARVTSFRTRPHPRAIVSKEVAPTSFDPYAYFLSSTDERRYRTALAQRGLPAQGLPDSGHPFESIKHTIVSPVYQVKINGQVGINRVLFADADSRLDSIHNGHLDAIPTIERSGLGTFAQQAYNRVAPSAVIFDAANFLGELREGLPKLGVQALKDQSRFFKGLGGDYLNVAFGWIPFIGALRDAAQSLARATRELPQQGQRVHRRYSVPDVSRYGEIPSHYGSVGTIYGTGTLGMAPAGTTLPLTYNGWSNPWTTSSGSLPTEKMEINKSFKQERWFEGEFSSFYPLNFDPTDYFSRLDQLVNVKLTPATLWELAPWSWLVDWSLRIGDSIEANELRANDLLVMHYGYAMERTVYTTELDARLNLGASIVEWPTRVRSMARTTVKRRIRANPYGFRIGGAAALTGSQLAILGALGLTKAL